MSFSVLPCILGCAHFSSQYTQGLPQKDCHSPLLDRCYQNVAAFRLCFITSFFLSILYKKLISGASISSVCSLSHEAYMSLVCRNLLITSSCCSRCIICMRRHEGANYAIGTVLQPDTSCENVSEGEMWHIDGLNLPSSQF